MPADIDFYFDFSSPYGYFASTRIDELAAEFGRQVKWQPVLLGAIFKTTGSQPLSTIPVKGQYALLDFERTARFHNIEYRLPPVFPISTHVAARAMIWLRDEAGHDKAVEFAKAIYRDYFVNGFDITQMERVLRAASNIGADAKAMKTAISGEGIKEQLKAEVAQALQRGVFGSPYIVIDNEPFWGFDRFEQIRTFLRDGKI
jgi:2-hydroxychromene-2-carboxylate isomerase